MAFGGFNKSAANSMPMAEINMVPLIDVMLVLLVIFIVTAPMITHAVKIDLPQASSQPDLNTPDKIELSIDGTGALFWNGDVLPAGDLDARLAQVALQTPQPELHLRADKTTQYQVLAEVMSAAAKQGVTKIGFVTEPGVSDVSLPAPQAGPQGDRRPPGGRPGDRPGNRPDDRRDRQ
ncbi:MAG: biopolymer transporter ExbD [Pseudomonadota bacterium]